MINGLRGKKEGLKIDFLSCKLLIRGGTVEIAYQSRRAQNLCCKERKMQMEFGARIVDRPEQGPR